jgi:glycosyltransferase involved in cell wall biosynthesis
MSGVGISVIIPVYNVERYLAECLDSVLSQTFADIEVICVNDGSTDGSLEILEKYRRIDRRIKLINQKNGGLGYARNVGFDNAKGEYISFIDSDDFVDVTFLEKLYNKATATNADFTLCNLYLNFMDTGVKRVYRDEQFFTFLKNKVFTATDYPEIITVIGVWDKLYKRDFLLKYNIRNPEKVIYEDRLFSVECYVNAERISVVNEPLYYYRKNTGNAITDKEKKELKFKFDFLDMTSKSIKLMIDKGVYDIFAYDYLANHFHNGLMHQSNIKEKDILALPASLWVRS